MGLGLKIFFNYFVKKFPPKSHISQSLRLCDNTPPDGQTKFCRFKVEQMNYNEITPYLSNVLRYPLFACVDKLDAFLMEKHGKTTGFDKSDLPSKRFFKEYLLHVDPKDEINCWTSYSSYHGLSKSGKQK